MENTDNTLSIKGYHIVRVHPQRMTDMQDLYMAVYGKSLAADYYAHKYNTEYTGIRDIGFIAYKDAEAAAYYGVIPCYLRYQGKVILAAQSADTMTHPKHQQKGLFTLLANLTYNLCQLEGIKLLFGFPNQRSLPGFVQKLGWHIAGYMECFDISVNTLPLEKMANKFGFSKNLYYCYGNSILKKRLLSNRGITNDDAHEADLSVERNTDYLQYKRYHDTRTMEINGMQIWFKIQDGLIIGDIKGQAFQLPDTLKALKKMAFQLGLNHIRWQTTPQTSLYTALQAHYPSFPTFPIILKAIDLNDQMDWGNIVFTYADIDIF